jgi:hypothetical protein
MLEQEEAQVLLAMEWYNQSFQKHSIRSIAGHLVDVATAFETLFQLPKVGKAEAFKKQIRQHLGLPEGSPMDDWAARFYKDVRSETVHSGKPLSLLFRHAKAQLPHLSFLWSAQRIFRECVAAKTGLPRHITNDRLIAELTPNEVHLSKLRQAGSFDNIRKSGLLEEVEKLRPVYPPGKREDIIWLGKELLGAYKRQFIQKGEQALPTLDLILQASDDDMELGLKYHQFLQEFRPVYFRYVAIGREEAGAEEHKRLKPPSLDNVEQRQIENAIYHFADFATWALILPT